MILLNAIDWAKIFLPATSILETIVRASVVYLSIFTILRVVLKREAATLGITDLLVVVLLADAAQNALVGESKSIADGILLVAVIVGWSYFLNFLGHRSPFFQKLIKPPKLLLVKNGLMLKRNMRKEFITEDELMAEIRTNGVKDLSEVEEAYMEASGRISVICRSGANRVGATDARLA